MKKGLALTLMLVLLASASLNVIHVNAQPNPELTIVSPHEKETYGNTIPMTLIAETYGTYVLNGVDMGWGVTHFYYSLDGRANVTITSSNKNKMDTLGGNTTLMGLSTGRHSIVVYAEIMDLLFGFGSTGNRANFSSNTVHFTVDSTPPIISNLTIENKTYNSTDIPLNFTVDDPNSHIFYCIDGQPNVTIAGNTMLKGLSYGSHKVTIYANDTIGNSGTSETIYFTISKTPEPAPFPSEPVVIASLAIAIVLGASLLVYFKKRNNEVTVFKVKHKK